MVGHIKVERIGKSGYMLFLLADQVKPCKTSVKITSENQTDCPQYTGDMYYHKANLHDIRPISVQHLVDKALECLQLRSQPFMFNQRELKKKTPWLWSASELCRPSGRRLLAM
jgi:hypothetical protein